MGRVAAHTEIERPVAFPGAKLDALIDLHVAQIMSSPPITVGQDEWLGAAYELMLANKVRRLLVVNRRGRLVGIISMSDVRASRTETGPLDLWMSRSRLAYLKVRDVMSVAPTCVGSADSIARPATIMYHHKFGGIPVVDDGVIVGIVTESDLFRALVKGHAAGQAEIVSQHVDRLMTRNPICTSPEVSIDLAAEIMRKHCLRRLPVVDKRDRLVGMVTLSDVLEAQVRNGPMSLWELHFRLADMRVKEVMARKLIVVEPHTSVGEAAELMLAHKVGGLPVVVDRQPVGIITESDIFRQLVEATQALRR
jgi:CBS domain-containing protein